MIRLPLFVPTILMYLALPCLAAEPPPAKWQDSADYFGPNGACADIGHSKLIDKVNDTRLAWKSEESGIGFGKAFSSASAGGYGAGLPPSGAAQPILADGLVVQFYSLPRGPVAAKAIEERLKDKVEQYRSFTYIDADDVVIAIDAATGKTRWKTVYESQGANRVPGKRGEFAVTPCAAGGKVFAVGTTGRVYALDLATGKRLWEASIGAVNERLEKLKAAALAQHAPFQQLVAGRERIGDVRAPCGALQVLDGVLLAPDWNGGLVGLSVADGSTLWSCTDPKGVLSGYNAPTPVKVDGKSYIACINAAGDLRLVDHRTGQVLWKQTLGGQHYPSPVFGKELLLVMDGVAGDNPKQQFGVLAGYRLTLAGAERVWRLDETKFKVPMWLDAGPSRKLTTRRDGVVYHGAWCYVNNPLPGEKPGQASKLLAVNEADGKILAQVDNVGHYWCIYLWGDKLFFLTDIQHGAHSQWRIYDPADLKLRDEAYFPTVGNHHSGAHLRVCGYEFPLHEIYADGFMFVREIRGKEKWGGIACYDLRASSAAAEGANRASK